MDATAITTLAGVTLGAGLTAMSQRWADNGNRLEQRRLAREATFAEFLCSYERMRKLLLTAAEVRLTGAPDGRRLGTPLIEGAATHWDAVQSANARVQIIAWRTPVDRAAFHAMTDLLDVARARATYGAGQVPQPTVDWSHSVIQEFLDAVHADLEHGSWKRTAASWLVPRQRRGTSDAQMVLPDLHPASAVAGPGATGTRHRGEPQGDLP
ncbi:hypothetical protein [Kineosporia sp. R_H_3]|uniref:hypothetical protein n=1 Tax=Kineosporia sp. R_H_3 TaxID=1961848 RepID=UPI000B4A8952|nr:hypothetical protein [Kineosporia sp. R_H_3]